MRLIFSLGISIFLISYTTATIRYVSKTGTSTPPYLTWETASDSIQKCINICNNGDTVIVANGVYKESLVIDSALTLIGSSMDSCIIDGREVQGWTFLIEAEYLTLHGFKLIGKGQNINYVGINSWLLDLSSCTILNFGTGIGLSSGVISNSIVRDILKGVTTFCPEDTCRPVMQNSVILVTPGTDSHGWKDSFGGKPTLTGNIIISMGGAERGIDHGPISRLTVKNNLIAGFTRWNIFAGGNPDSVIIENNISRDFVQTAFPEDAGISGVAWNAFLINNIISNNELGVYFHAQPIKSDYNLYYNNITDVNSGIGIGENDVFADPMFVKDTIAKSLQYDYHLQMFSPGIDAGDPDILDRDGSRSDIGMYGGPLGMTYSYQDLPPKPPKDFTVNLDTSTGFLNVVWSKYTEADFSHYNVHRSPAAGFSPDSTNLFTVTDTSFFSDTLSLMGDKFYYKVISVDSGGSFSPPGPEIAVEISDVNEPEIRITDEYQLYQNYPNPFNSSTKIPFSISEKGKVRIVVYDIKGEVIKELMNREIEKGYHEADLDMGQLNLSSGIYLYRIEVTGQGRIPRYMTMRKMVYLK